MQAREISQRLTERAEDVAKFLLPNGRLNSGSWVAGDVNGNTGKSLSVCLQGDKRGVFSDFATGQSGDLLTLWCANRAITIPYAINEAKRYLGIASTEKMDKRSVIAPLTLNKSIHLLKPHSSIGNYLQNDRKLLTSILDQFRIMQTEQEIIFPYYHGEQLLNIKYLKLERRDGKKIIRAEKDAQPCLFGWQALDKDIKKIALCEGEIDAMSLHQYGISALSVPFGGGTGNKHKWLEFEFDYLADFTEIYLCFDQDETGKQATEDLSKRLGEHRCRIVTLPYKDANECLQNGISTEKMQVFFDQSKTLDPDELKPATLFSQLVINKFYPPEGEELGIKPLWDKTGDKILFRPAELSVWTGTNGHGKSQFLGQIMLDALFQGYRVCVASLELKPERLLMRLARQAAALDRPTEEYINAIHEWYEDKLWVFALTGTAKTERLLEVFKYARQRYGVNMFVIDSFMKCGVSEEDYSSQKKFIEQLCDFKNDYNCHIHLIIHPRKGVDETRPPGKLDVKGTGSVTDLADNCFTIWRNKVKEDKLRQLKTKNELIPDELVDAPDCLWLCDKQRNGEWEGRIAFWFDQKSFQYLAQPNHKPKRYVEFSNFKHVNQLENIKEKSSDI